MVLYTGKSHMNRVVQICLFLFLVFVPSTLWIYSKCVNPVLKDDKRKEMDEHKRTKREEIPNNIEQNEDYPMDIIRVLESIRMKNKEGFHEIYEYDQNNKQRKIFQAETIEESKRTNIEIMSNEIEENETYPIDISYIPESIRRKQKKGMLQTYEDDQKCVKELRNMLQSSESTQGIDFEEDFLRSFIISEDCKIDQAFSKMENFLNLRIDHNYLFHNLSFDFTQNPAYRFVTILPHRQKDGTATILFELAKWDPDIVPLDHLKRIMFIICTQVLRNPVTQASGLNFIYDFADAGFRYIKYGSPQNLFLLQHVSFECMPTKYIGYHLVNINVIGNLLVMLTRPFIPKEIENIFHTHSSVKELLNFFPSSMLPVQYGGNLTEYYPVDWIREANQQHGYFPPGGQKNTF